MAAIAGLAFCSPVLAVPKPGQDLLLGNGTAGPFALSWKKIEANTERVQVDALPQMRGLDYTLDADAGTVTFTRPLPSRSTVRVDYAYDPDRAARVSNGLTLPLGLTLFQGERGSVSLNAIYQKPDTGDSQNGSLTVGMGMAWQGANDSQVSTHLLYAPPLAAQVGVPNGAARIGLAVAGSSAVGSQTQVSFGFSRAGNGLGEAASSDMAAGRQTLTLGTQFSPGKQVQAVFSYADSSLLESPKGGGKSSKTALALTVTPSDKVHLETHLSQADADGKGAHDADMTLSVKPNNRVSLQTGVAQESTGAGQTTQTVTASVDARPTGISQVNASYSDKNAPGAANDAQAMALNAKITPNAVVSLNAELGHQRQGDKTVNSQAVQMALSPRPEVTLQTGVALHQDSENATVVASIDGKVRPLPFLEINGGYHDRTAPAADLNGLDNLDTSHAQIALAPLRTVRLTGTYVQNPDMDGHPERLAQRGLGVETTLGSLSVSGGYDWLRHYDSPDVGASTHVDVGLRFSSAALFQLGYQQSLVGLGTQAQGRTLLTVGFTKQLGERLNLSLRGKRQQAVGASMPGTPDYDASANLGMKF